MDETKARQHETDAARCESRRSASSATSRTCTSSSITSWSRNSPRMFAHREDLDDAGSFAWIQFFRYQPDRDRGWKGWLYRTAQREAWRLNAEHGRKDLRIVPDADAFASGVTREPCDPRDRLEERLEFLAAMEEVQPSRRTCAPSCCCARSSVAIATSPRCSASTARAQLLLRHVGVYLQEHASAGPSWSARSRPRARRVCVSSSTTRRRGWLRRSGGRPRSTRARPGPCWPGVARRSRSTTTAARPAGARKRSPRPDADRPKARRAHERAARAVAQVRDERLRQRGLGQER